VSYSEEGETALYLRDVSLKLGSGVVAFVMNFVYGVVIARALGAEGNGLAALLILIPTMIATFGSLGIDKANGYLAGAKKWSVQVLLGNSLSLATTIGLLIGVAYWVAMPLTLDLLSSKGIDQPIMQLAFAIAPLALIEMYLQGILWGLGRIPQLSLVSIVRFFSQLALSVILVVVLKLGVKGAVIAAIVTPGLCIALYMVFLGNETGLRISCSKNALKDSLAFGVQVHLGSVLQLLNYRLDLLIVNYLLGVISVGYYVVAASLAELIWYFPDACGFVLFPKTASSDPKAATQFTPKVVRVSVFLTAIAAFGLFLVSRWLIATLYKPEFLPAVHPLWALLPGTVCLSLSKVIFSDLGGRGMPYYGTIASLVSLCVTIGLDLVLIPRWGILGAAIASSLSYLTNAFVALAVYSRLTGNTPIEVLFVQRSDLDTGLKVGHDIVLRVRKSLRA
jgi:O-antigen/teichoic acid export membrane protein